MKEEAKANQVSEGQDLETRKRHQDIVKAFMSRLKSKDESNGKEESGAASGGEAEVGE